MKFFGTVYVYCVSMSRQKEHIMFTEHLDNYSLLYTPLTLFLPKGKKHAFASPHFFCLQLILDGGEGNFLASTEIQVFVT